jgi:hypothetical protein
VYLEKVNKNYSFGRQNKTEKKLEQSQEKESNRAGRVAQEN